MGGFWSGLVLLRSGLVLPKSALVLSGGVGGCGVVSV